MKGNEYVMIFGVVEGAWEVCKHIAFTAATDDICYYAQKAAAEGRSRFGAKARVTGLFNITPDGKRMRVVHESEYMSNLKHTVL